MKNLKYLVIFAIIAIISLSCKKDDVEEVTETDDYTVTYDGSELTEGQEVVFNVVDETGQISLSVKNISNSEIFLKSEIISVAGNYASETFGVCMGDCAYALSVPYVSGTYSLGANQTSGATDIKFFNTDDRSGNLTFNLRLFQVDENGAELTSEKAVNFTYKYVAP